MNELSVVLEEQMNLPSISAALPENFNKARFVQNCMALMNDKPELKKREQGEVVNGLLKGAFLGLDFFNGECHLVPYGSELKFFADYKGLVKLAKTYSVRPVADIYARIVREGDVFEEKIVSGEQTIDFKPVPFNEGKILGAFAVCQYEDGGIRYEVMSKKELDAAKRMSKAQNGSAWQFFSEEMYKKIVIRRLCKGISLNFENPKQTELFTGDEKIVEGEAKEVDNPFGS